jgi:hypothetical protein
VLGGTPAVSDAARAYAFAESLANGFVTPSEVTPWIDGVVLRTDDPSAVLLDAGMARDDCNRLIELLHTFGGDANQSDVAQYLFADMAAALQRDASVGTSIARALYQMALDGHWPHPDAEAKMYYFEDAFDLARQQIQGDVETVRAELSEFLRRFRRERSK